MSNLYAGYFIANTLELLFKYNDTITEKSDIIKVKNRINMDFLNIQSYLNELNIILMDNRYSNTKEHIDIIYLLIESSKLRINEKKDVVEIKNEISELQQRIINLSTDIMKELRSLTLNRVHTFVDYLNDNLTTDYNLFTEEDSEKIKTAIKINREYNIFSPNAFGGHNLLSLATDKALTYGLESGQAYDIAKTTLHKAIKGGMVGSKISNNTFDILHLVPPISWITEYNTLGSLIEKKEKSHIRNAIKYLKQDGICIITMPYTRLTRDTAYVIAKLLKDVQIIKCSNNDFYIHLIGIKNITKDAKEDIYKMLSNIVYSNIGKELDFEYKLPQGPIKEPEIFRGSLLDEDDLNSIIRNSGLLESFIEKQNKVEDDSDKKPLLPFNIGQIGLVLTSGCLDGLVKEFDGQYHAIKGMVTKISNVENSTEDNNETSVETISNKVQINIVTPDGKFIELA